MEILFRKLNYKTQRVFVISNLPEELSDTKDLPCDRDVFDYEIQENRNYDFILAFVLTREDISSVVEKIKGNFVSDALIWFAYPKKSSQKYTTEIGRVSGWEPLGELNVEPVRQVAISEDWTALRFREVENIKNMTRKGMAISDEGEERIKDN